MFSLRLQFKTVALNSRYQYEVVLLNSVPFKKNLSNNLPSGFENKITASIASGIKYRVKVVNENMMRQIPAWVDSVCVTGMNLVIMSEKSGMFLLFGSRQVSKKQTNTHKSPHTHTHW